MESKHPLASVTNWAAFLLLLQAALVPFGIQLDVELGSELIAGVADAVLALVVIWGRARADRPIRWTPQ